MSHNLELDYDVPAFDPPGSYIKEIIYSASLQQIIVLIDNSIDCKQHIEIKCKDATFGYTYTSPSDWHHWWQNRNGSKMFNWGAPTGIIGCECSSRNGTNGMWLVINYTCYK